MFSSVKRLIKRWVPGAPTFSETNEQHTPQKTDDGGLAAMDVPPTPVEERQFKAPSPRYNRSPTQQPNIRPQPDFRQPNTPVRLFTPAQHTPTRNVTPYNPNTPTERQLRYMEQLRPEDGWITSASRRLNRLPTLAPGTPKRMPVSQLTVDESVLAGNKRGRDDDDEYERFDPSSQPVAVKRRQIEYEESVVTRTPLRRSSAPQRQVTPRSRIKLKSSRPNANKDLRWLISRMPPVDHDKTDQMAKNLLENTEKLYRDQREAEERKVVEENNRVNGLRMAEEQRRAAEQRKIDDERREEAELARQQKAQLDEQARKQAEEQKRAEQPPQTNAASSGFAFKPPAQQSPQSEKSADAQPSSTPSFVFHSAAQSTPAGASTGSETKVPLFGVAESTLESTSTKPPTALFGAGAQGASLFGATSAPSVVSAAPAGGITSVNASAKPTFAFGSTPTSTSTTTAGTSTAAPFNFNSSVVTPAPSSAGFTAPKADAAPTSAPPTFTFGALAASSASTPGSAADTTAKPAFPSFGTSVPSNTATEASKPAATGTGAPTTFTFGSSASTGSAPLTFGAGPTAPNGQTAALEPPKFGAPATNANSNDAKFGVPSGGSSSMIFGTPPASGFKTDTVPATSSAPAFQFGAPASNATTSTSTSTPAQSFTFGAPAAAPGTSTPSTFTFGTPASSGASTSSQPASSQSFPGFGASNIGTSTPSAAPAFTFGAKPAAPAFGAPTSAPGAASTQGFNFGAAAPASMGASAPASLNFGAGAPATSTPAAPSFNFGASAPAAPTSTSAQAPSMFNFGNSAPASNPAPAAPAPTAFNFGAAAPAPSGGGFTFGAKPAGSAAAVPPQFGATSAAPSFGAAAGAFNFGGQPAPSTPTAAPGTGGFSFTFNGAGGAGTPQPGTPTFGNTPFQFGQQPASPSTGAFTFGAAPSAPANPIGAPEGGSLFNIGPSTTVAARGRQIKVPRSRKPR